MRNVLMHSARSMFSLLMLFGIFAIGDCCQSDAATPQIASLSPTSSAVGTTVTISGTNFDSIQTNDIVYFGAVQAPVTSATTTTLNVTVPTGATFAPITVTISGLTAYSPMPFLPTFSSAGILTNSSLGPLIALPTGLAPGKMVIADFDGDGKPDLAVNCGIDHTVYIYRNISTNSTLTVGSFAPPVVLQLGTGGEEAALVAADVDGDGKLDLVLLDPNLSQVMVLQNFCTPGNITTNSFGARVNFAVGSYPRDVAVRDLDGDGKPEIVTANWGDSTISVLRNIGPAGIITTNSFAPAITFTGTIGTTTVAIDDIDGDGKPDMVTIDEANNSSGNAISVFRNISTLGNIAFAQRIDFPAPMNSYQLAIGDMDGDGKLDVVFASFAGGQSVSMYRNISTPGTFTTNSFAPRVDFGLGGWGNGLALGDLDGDGKLDVAAVSQLSSQLSLFRNISNPGSFTSSSLAARLDFASGWNPYGVAIGDLDGDGRPDIVFANNYDNTISIYQNVVPLGGPPSCDPAPSGLASWWRAENNAFDSIGANNGAMVGGAGYANGEVGQAFSFNGNGQYVGIPQSPSLNPSNQLTIEFWMKADPTNSMTTYQGLVTSDFYGIEIAPSLFIYLSSDNGASWAITPGAIVSSGVWHHVAGTYDGAYLRLYIDGQIWGSPLPHVGAISPMLPNSFVAIGSEDGRTICACGGNRYFNGLIDEVSIYNRALSSFEIAAIYSAGSAGKCLPVNQPPVADATATLPFVISVNGSNAVTVLDGSLSYDPDGDPLQYSWFETGSVNVLTNGVVAVVTLPVGTNSITLLVSDGSLSSQQAITVYVATIAQAIERLIAIESSDASAKQSLIATLRAALASIDRSNSTSAVNQLQAFQNQVNSRLAPIDPVTAQSLIDDAQAIIDAINGGGTANTKIKMTAKKSNGKLHLNFSATHGQIYIIEASLDMVNWEKIGIAKDQGNGTFEFDDNQSGQLPVRFYRIVVP